MKDGFSFGREVYGVLYRAKIAEITPEQAVQAIIPILNQTNNIKICAIHMGDDLVQILLKALETNHTVLELDLFDNALGLVSAQAVARMLRKNHTLQYITIGANKIGDEGVQIIAAAFPNNISIQKIGFVGCKVTDKGARAILDALPNNSSLKEIHLNNNAISPWLLQGIEQLLKEERAIQADCHFCLGKALADNEIAGFNELSAEQKQKVFTYMASLQAAFQGPPPAYIADAAVSVSSSSSLVFSSSSSSMASVASGNVAAHEMKHPALK